MIVGPSPKVYAQKNIGGITKKCKGVKDCAIKNTLKCYDCRSTKESDNIVYVN